MINFRIGFTLCLFTALSFWTSLQQSGFCQESGVVATASGSEDPKETITNSVGMKLVPISAGRFTMGSPASEPGSQENELLHKVDLTESFHMGATEVTEHQWAMIMEEPFRTEMVEVRDPETKRLIKREEKQIKNPKLDSQLPIADISWFQAVEFCNRLGQLPEEKKEGRNYRLPTEAEWEYACRCGTSTAYSFGDDAAMLSEYDWCQGEAKQRMAVARKKPNGWGLFDMHGNVAEWCHDYYSDYPEKLVVDPAQPEKPSTLAHVYRGGFVDCKPSWARSAFRGRWYGKGKLIGFRVLLGKELPNTSLEQVVNSIGQRLVKIPAGTFQMGQIDIPSEPAHEVEISRPFFIATTEVTQGQWKTVMGTEPWKVVQDMVEGDQIAANQISWDQATEYCRRLSAMPKERAAGRVYRLPTEAEWEYACRAGMTTNYNFGNEVKAIDTFAWYLHSEKPHKGPQIVGQKEPNFWGLYDMHGNVSEWCSDWYQEISRTDRVRDPKGPSSGSHRVMRGGAGGNSESECRSAYRMGNDQNRFFGFRVALNQTSQ